VLQGRKGVRGAEEQRDPSHGGGGRASPGQAEQGAAEGKLLGNGRGERNPHGQVIDRLAAADVDDPPVAEERPRRRQERAEYDPAGRDRRSGEPET
jgi:hypothetical protein